VSGAGIVAAKKRIAVFIGTRPEAIKLAPVIASLEVDRDLEPIVVATGQHTEMFRQVAELFGFPVHAQLDVMRTHQTLAELSAKLLLRIDAWLTTAKPEMSLVQGDTTTVLAAALASYYRGIPIAHVEAGLRTWDIFSPFPEEANRRLTSLLATLHFAPTDTARQNLLREGISGDSIETTGNPGIDALLIEVARQDDPRVRCTVHQRLTSLVAADWDKIPSVLITGHRRENFGRGFEEICAAVAALARRFSDHRFIYPVHLNPNVQEPVRDRLSRLPNVVLIEPVDYRLFVALMNACRLILTDSGGVQEEAPSLGKPVLVMRDTTERPEGVDAGTVMLTGANAAQIVQHATELLTDPAVYRRMAKAVNPYGDGRASERIVARIRRYLEHREGESPA
jgi:UDP-N-acetylglucosamine 2-epimerase (non-hydrolysing)